MGEPLFEPAQVPFKAQKAEQTYVLRVNDETVMCGVVGLGNPHCVIAVDSVDTAPVDSLGAAVAAHERFPESVNVGFMQQLSADEIKLVSLNVVLKLRLVVVVLVPQQLQAYSKAY